MAAAPASGAATAPRRWIDAAALPWLGLGALVALQAALIVTHVAWRDELQALMVAAHSPTFRALLANLHYEGHPALWYLLLRAATFVAPANPQLLIGVQLAIVGATMAIVWKRAPFTPWVRLAILASTPLLFEWGTLARSYGLGVALYVGALALNRRPAFAFLLLGLVANTALHFLMLAGVTALYLLWLDRRRALPGFVLFCALALLSVGMSWQAADGRAPFDFPDGWASRALMGLYRVSRAVLTFDPSHPGRWGTANWLTGLVAGVVVPVLGLLALRRERVPMALFALLAAALWAFSAAIYPASTRHAAVLYLFVIGAEWIRLSRGGVALAPAMMLWTGLLTATGLWYAAVALVVPFTPIRDVLRTADAAGLTGGAWAAYPGYLGVEMSARLGRPVYDAQQDCLAWFQRWNTLAGWSPPTDVLGARLAAAAAASGGRMALVSDADLSAVPGVTLLGVFPASIVASPSSLYVVTAPAGDGAAPAPCP